MRLFSLALFTLFFSFQSVGVAQAADISRQELRQAVKELLRDEPEIIMDIIKSNSETILEVAQQGNIQRKRRALVQQWEQDVKTPKNIITQGRLTRGNPKAPVTIAVFSDYTCSFCKQAEFLLEVLLETRKTDIKVVFFHYPKENETSIISAKYALAASLQSPEKAWNSIRCSLNSSLNLKKIWMLSLPKLVPRLALTGDSCVTICETIKQSQPSLAKIDKKPNAYKLQVPHTFLSTISSYKDS